MERLLPLDDDRALDLEAVGDKAAGLAAARRAGLPALPGWVVPAAEAAGTLSAGAAALARSGRSAAVLHVCGSSLPPRLERELLAAAADLGPRLIVRSSSALEADARWSGAFASYTDVAPDDLRAAVLGCWASAFSRDALDRGEALGVAAAGRAVGVLLQPWIAFDEGGTAAAMDHGSVRVTGAAGPPSAVVAGRAEGVAVTVRSDGRVDGASGVLAEGLLRAVAGLARRAGDATGRGSVEWGAVRDRVVLLQVREAVEVPAAQHARTARRRTHPLPVIAERLAAAASRFPGPLADRLILPWAAGSAALPRAPRIRVGDPSAALAALCAGAGELTASAWRSDAATAERRATEVLRAVLGPAPREALRRLERLEPVDPALAMRVLGLAEGLGRALADAGALSRAGLVWRLTLGELQRTVRTGTAPPERLGPGRWEPFVADVVAGNGRALLGTPIVPGVGAGRLHVLRTGAAGSRPEPRAVLAVRAPVPHVAPLLWGAAGLAVASGSPGAHLFEVARSLGVPTVLGVELATDGALTAVDGDAGVVSALEARPPSAGRMGA